MKKFALIVLMVLLVGGWMVDSALADRYVHSRYRGPRGYWSGSLVVAGPVYPYARYAPRPVVVRRPAVYVPPLPVYPVYSYYPVTSVGYYPYARNYSAGWAIWGP